MGTRAEEGAGRRSRARVRTRVCMGGRRKGSVPAPRTQENARQGPSRPILL